LSQIQTYEQRMGTFRELLQRMKAQFALAAPRHLTPDRVMRLALNQAQRNPKLLECDPKTVLGALMTCTQIGLEPDDASGRAYLIPYKDRCTLVIGYKGLMELAHRSEKVEAIEARVVREDDVFEVRLGTEPSIKHIPSLGSDRPLVAVYAVACLAGGRRQFEVMARSEVESIRQRSSAVKSGRGGPWDTDYDEMARKTVTRKLCKYLPSSAELQRAVTLDEQQDAGLPQDLVMVEVDSGGSSTAPPPKTLNAVAAKRRGRPPKSDQSTVDAETPPDPEPVDGGRCSVGMAATIMQRLARAQKIRGAWKCLTPEQRSIIAGNYKTDLGALALSKTGFEDWTSEAASDLLFEIEQAQITGPDKP